jgi:hypothetical protein
LIQWPPADKTLGCLAKTAAEKQQYANQYQNNIKMKLIISIHNP